MGVLMTNSPSDDDEVLRANRRRQARPWWERSSGETLDDILDDAMNGHLQPKEVETIAREKGWPDPLSSWREEWPGILAEDHWTFAMAVAWISWRNEVAVREVWPRWLDHLYLWVPTEVMKRGPDGDEVPVRSWHLELLGHTNATVFRLHDLALTTKHFQTPVPAISVEQGLRDLVSRLRTGNVHAIRHGRGVPPEVWLALTHDGYGEGPQAVGTSRVYAPDWKISVPSFEILKWWPETLPIPPHPGRRQGGESKRSFLLRRLGKLQSRRSAAEFRDLARDWLEPSASDDDIQAEGRRLASSWRDLRSK